MVASALWPASVPQVSNQDGYTEAPERNVAEFRPEVGPPKLRRRSAVSTDMLQFTTTMTSDQFDALVDFYRSDLADGSLTFLRKHPRDLSGVDLEFMFMNEPSYGARGPNYGEVAIALRRMP